MATIYLEAKTGRRTIQFVDENGRRQSIRLGKITLRNANALKHHVEGMVSAKLAGHVVDDQTARWLGSLGKAMNEKLAKVGLVSMRDCATLKAFVDEYVAGRSDIKDRSVSRIREAGQKLVDCFGANRSLRDFTVGDAHKFRQWLLAKGLAENTVRRNCGRAKQFFRAALRRKLINENPFLDLVSAVRGNPSKFHFVELDDAARVIAACPDAEWRLIFALSRFGGLRCPSETLSLRWSDVDWANSRVRVPSPKTEHIEGKESRMIPLFPELRPCLAEAFELATPGAEFVITRYRSIKQNLATQFKRIIRRAGLEPWVKPFQNLRSTRETELARTFPEHVACAWIGNSEAVARKHYFQVTESDFQTAADGGKKALQNPRQHTAETARTIPQGDCTSDRENSELPSDAIRCNSLQDKEIPLLGSERARP